MLQRLAFRSILPVVPARSARIHLRFRFRMSAQPNAGSSAGPQQRPIGYPSLKDTAKLPVRPGFASLQRSAFNLRVPIIAVRVEVDKIGKLRNHPAFKDCLMDIPKVRLVVDEEDRRFKRLRLRLSSEKELSDQMSSVLGEMGGQVVDDAVDLDYDHWSASEVLNSILPDVDDGDAPSSFTHTGHIAHVNLRDEWLPYKGIIGQVLLDKNPKLRTVVNKLNSIHATYRYFDMEVLAGEPDFITMVHESNCEFHLDFRTVYWNSRLHHEHERLVRSFQPGDVIADVMAGVGPFAVPAAKKGCYVWGNDLNPEGVKWMEVNRVKNKVENTLRISNLDGREFIQTVGLKAWTDPFQPGPKPLTRKEKDEIARAARRAREAVKLSAPGGESTASAEQSQPPPQPKRAEALPEKRPQQVDHFILNLPDSALTFLDAFRGCLRPLLDQKGFDRQTARLPMVHVHCFTREMERDAAETDILARASGYLEHSLKPDTPDYNLHLVRSVAPNKEMYCLSFRLPAEVAFARDAKQVA